ncbi:tyrosine-type recombinase/integrase [Actinomadura luteofluorescens]|uniref:tyrosine-type recombinase/integrase n=1 Tax=Actinomadura luteofluorescens TaxID=46163 RepID=UPI00346C4C7A
MQTKDRNESSRKTRMTTKSCRPLVLTPEIMSKRRTPHERKHRLALGGTRRTHGLIPPSEVGTPTDPDNSPHTFTKPAQRTGLSHWHPHEPRHSGASLLLAQGTSLHVVSEIPGHAGITITKDTYGHLIVDDKRAAAKVMNGAPFGN